MNVLLLNGSPKKRFSASGFFLKVLKVMLPGCRFTEYKIGSKNQYGEIMQCMKSTDAVVISVPIYMDGTPSHVLDFLQKAEQFCKEHTLHCKLYVISNAGFIEGRQNRPHLEQYRCWCERAGIIWGGGLGIGGGIMLHFLFYWQLIDVGLFLSGILFNWVTGSPPVTTGSLANIGRSIFIWLFLNSGMLFYMGRLAHVVKKKVCVASMYTRAMIPSFLFLICADIFMLLSALLKGKLIFSLYKR